MKERASSATAAEPVLSNPRDPTGIAASTQPYIQNPEKAAHSHTWRSHRNALPPQPSDDTLSTPPLNDIRQSKHSPGETPISIRSSKSSGGPHRNNPDFRRTSPAVSSPSHQQRNSYQEFGHSAHHLNDPEKANPTRTAAPNDPHTSHAISIYNSEEEEEVIEEHTIWILVSQ